MDDGLVKAEVESSRCRHLVVAAIPFVVCPAERHESSV